MPTGAEDSAVHGLTEAEHLRLQFWTEFKAVAEARGIDGLPPPTSRYNYDVALGRSEFKVAMTFRVRGAPSGWPPIGVGCELYIEHRDSKAILTKLKDRKDEIHLALGELEWWPLARACRIARYLKEDVRDRRKWPELFEWLVARLEGFRLTFTPLIQSKDF